MSVAEKTSEPMHVIVERLRGFLALLTMVVTFVSAGSAWLITRATSEVSAEVQTLQRRADVDSERFDRAMEVVELVAVALVEPEGTPERAEAVRQLRARRRVIENMGAR